MLKKQRKDDTRSFIFSTAISSIFFCIFFLRDETPFNLIKISSNPSFLEEVGLLFILFLVPPIIYFIILPSEIIENYASSRETAISSFLGVALGLSFFGIIIGVTISFLIGIIFYNLI